MIEVKLDEGDRIDWALKTFKRKVLRAGILKDLRRRRHYLKPSEAKHLKSQAAQRRAHGKRRAE
ncbi:MAG TPA: 30S ribosomal protein S21 [Gemmatimonadaceae bacterium]|jgi:small subunit ribosomal protein S21|nr:30S ribosomal protein S21 [Gemmatimonadaceae bacterium]